MPCPVVVPDFAGKARAAFFGKALSPPAIGWQPCPSSITQWVGASHIASAKQVHGTACIVVGGQEAGDPARFQAADALFTTDTNLALGIKTADCCPVVFVAGDGSAVAIAHAGWRGALAGVTDTTIEAFRAHHLPAADLRCVIGPTIGVSSYQIDKAVRDPVLQMTPDAAACFQPNLGETAMRATLVRDRWQFDLPHYVWLRLVAAGVLPQHIRTVRADVCALDRHFHSHRRYTQQARATGEPLCTDRQLSVVARGV